MRRTSISIVIPVHNEADLIAASLNELHAWRARGHEVIVVDGNSMDATTTIATPLCDQVIRSPKGRAIQMNAGAAAARGDVLIFLHVDTTLPENAEAELRAAARDRDEFWGRFDIRLDARPVIYRIIEFLMNWRSRRSGIATGDQAIFVSRLLFERSRGFPPIALMEDIALCANLRREVPPECLRSQVKTSARRWQRDGVAKTITKMWWLRAAFFFGVSPERLRASYDRLDPADV